MENKLNLPLKKKKNEAESPRLDPLMRALKALHSAGAPETMTEEELEHQRRSQEVLGRLTAPMAGMDYEEFSLGGMNAAWMRLKAPHGSRHAILYCHGGRLHERQPRLRARARVQARARHGLRRAEL